MKINRAQKSILAGVSLSLFLSTIIFTAITVPIYFESKWPDYNPYDWETSWVTPESVNGSACTFRIKNDIATPFGLYSPNSISFTPSIIPTEIEPDLSNVAEIPYNLDSETKQLLAEYGFVLRDEGEDDIFAFYDASDSGSGGNYITTDLCLHTYHILYDMNLRIMEGENFYQNLEIMIKALRDDQKAKKTPFLKENIRTALNKNIAYLSTILKLLNDSNSIPVDVKKMTQDELTNIENGFEANSAIFGYLEDFSQYKIRGHYTRNEILGSYFKAMMYVGRMGFLIQGESLTEEENIEQTRMAMLLISSFNSTIDTNTVWDYWESIYRPTSFFVGVSDDLTVVEYYKLWNHYGKPEGNNLADDNLIKNIIENLKTYPSPRIISMIAGDSPNIADYTRGMRLMGQRFIPDSYIFQQLVHSKVRDRLIPKAFDIFYVFGSARAGHYLQGENETFSDYSSQILKLQKEFGNFTDLDWTQNLYWLWLYTLFPLLKPADVGYPGYMLNDTWTDKALMTTLGSWAELRHDSILYGKQSYSGKGGGSSTGYVEPYPELYSRLSSLVSLMLYGLDDYGLLSNDFKNRLNNTIEIFNSLVDLSIKELENQPFTQEDISFIYKVVRELEEITTFTNSSYEIWLGDTDKRMAIIADVHTDTNTNQVLEVGTGNPFAIYVIVQDDEGNLRVTKGGTYSFYEFIQPISNRLTDEEWHEMLSNNPPALPYWIENSLPIVSSSTVMLLFTCESYKDKKKKSSNF